MTLAMRPRGRREGERGDQELRIAAVDSECVERQLEENRREGGQQDGGSRCWILFKSLPRRRGSLGEVEP